MHQEPRVVEIPPIRPLILCGGSGTRLWPLSSELAPKQLLSLTGKDSLLQATVRRVSGEFFQAPILVTAEAFGQVVADQLAAIGAQADAIALEPAPRNTAPAIAAAAFAELLKKRDPLILAMPSDHVVMDDAAFTMAVRSAVPAADAGQIVTFGIRPTRPETGYGYIEADRGRGNAPARAVIRFTEKPDAAIAAEYVRGKRHFWNAGIFLFRASTIVKELKLHARNVATACEAAVAAAESDGAFLHLAKDEFLSSPAISIDYAVLEKSKSICMVEADIGWSDIGSWEALWEIGEKDPDGNVTFGNVLLFDSRGCLVRNELDTPLALIDATDLVAVVTASGSLIVPRESAQKTKLVADALRKDNS